MYKAVFKRLADIVASTVILTILSPLWVIVLVLLLISNKGKAFFVQKRIGRFNQPFNVIKFKSMNDKKDRDGNLLKDVQRLTKVGKFIRKTSLDELPQLFNVIKGDMSLVGPRPLLTEYLPYYNEYHIRRHEVRPGITGLAQVEGRNTLAFSQRLNYDVTYVDSLSLKTDLRILFKTLLKVVAPKDVQLGVKPLSEIDDIGLTVGLPKHYFNVEEREK